MRNISILSFLFLALAAFMIPKILGNVLDTDGNQVLAGTEYYILPAVTGNGGGLLINGTSCPPDVVQESDEANFGYPMLFYPVNSSSGDVVMTDTDSNVDVSAASICLVSLVWTLKVDSETGLRFVSTGGVKGNPGRETGSNWFKIKQFDDAYKLHFCPTVCNYCRPQCADLGISISPEDRTRRLVALPREADALKVVFKKA